MKQRLIENLNNPIFNKKLNLYFKIFPERKLQDDIDLLLNSSNFQISKVEIIPALYERILSNLLYEASIHLIPNPSTDNIRKL